MKCGGGIDGCRAGWLTALVRDGKIEFSIHHLFTEAIAALAPSGLVFVDIPIGLPSNDAYREADVLARKLLGPRRSSVFFAPAREGLKAKTYEELNSISRAISGKGVSKQLWFILPKIKEVDSFLRHAPQQLERVLESHPELCFTALNEGVVPTYSKKTQQGQELRLALIEQYLPGASKVIEQANQKTLKKHALQDDFVDASVLALSAARACASRKLLKRVPEPSELDSAGLPMQICFLRNHEFPL